MCSIGGIISSTFLEHYTDWMLHVQSWWLLESWKLYCLPWNLQCLLCWEVVLYNEIDCPHCEVSYVGKTSRHLLSRFREHKSRSSGPVKKHLALRTKHKLRLEDMEILASTIRSDAHLSALFIREVKPFQNTQSTKEQDYKQRELRILFW